MEISGIVFTVYQVRGQWKVVHCTRAAGRLGRSVVVNLDSEAAARPYAEHYAATAA